ncbi:putative NBD/HSP70 family sugar kinase [Rhodoglobus vestalii]|uniref:Putative NBD/HSP70 family sugar kinase n=1 Tax=Rhodoglobus vestalii TaxID=193384 RepID=A0A8H2PWV0_9MICO|nr:ROK family protein [Rhodoglobus vestalii]TQO19540.1 putative NBD/HSP70 family sugar kinase [Rhodoglobus vestalii]
MAHAISTGSGVVLDLIRAGQATTRSDLITQLGWSRITLARRLDELLNATIIVSAGQSDSRGGRPPEEFVVNKDAGLLLAMDIGGSHSRLAITDLVSNILLEDEADIGLDQGPDDIFDWSCQVFDHLLDRLNKSRSDVRGIGVGVPGPVDPASGRIASPQVNAQWADVVVKNYFPDDYRAVFAVDRDVNILAVGEHRLGWPEYDDAIVLKVGMGIGCGLVFGGRVYHGTRGGAGDLAHTPSGGSNVCLCGRTGCLDTVASGRAIERELHALGATVRTSADIVALAHSGHEGVAQLLADAGNHIAEALLDPVALLNPSAIVVGGNIAHAGAVFLDPIRERLLRVATAFSRRDLVVIPAKLGHQAGVIGASLIAQDALFEPDRISRLTRDGGASLQKFGEK